MKLEEGMYVRFYNGDFGKVANYEYREEYVNGHIIHLENDDIGLCCEEKDFKASHNIIDLIEVGDYVNGHLVTKISKDGFVWLEGYSVDGTWKYVDFINEWGDNIKSIVTSQQFESMQYKVG